VIAIYGRVATTGLFIATYESSREVAPPSHPPSPSSAPILLNKSAKRLIYNLW
jgi:hypothetical protein